MNRFIRYDNNLEQAVKRIVSKNFPAVDLGNFSGFNIDSFRTNTASRLVGGEHIAEIVESGGDGTSKKYMIFTTSRWGGSTVVR